MIRIFLSLAIAWGTMASAWADDKSDATKVVDDFYANYITSIIKRERGEKVVQRSEHLSPAFKKAYAELQAKAWKEDPELGLGYDPIICGQDFPDVGYAVKTIQLKGNTGSAVLASKDKNFEGSIPVTLVKIDGKWFINGIEKLQGK